MRGSDFVVDFLIKHQVTDVYGIPGGVVLDFLYALNHRSSEIKPHLNFHEHNSISSASGFAWSSNNLGVAYATRGPGITNMVTGVADAYCDSIPILIITGHSATVPENGMRVTYDQEINVVEIFSSITKYAERIDKIEDIKYKLEMAYFEAMDGRKGPVLLDIHSDVLSAQINPEILPSLSIEKGKKVFKVDAVKKITQAISDSKRPVFLLGDGFRGTKSTYQIKEIAEQNNIPILSSRFSQDLFQSSANFFGYVASKGLRYSNFIISKSDLIIIIGNRMTFPIESKSFSKIVNDIPKIRIDIDETELNRRFPNCNSYVENLANVVSYLKKEKISYKNQKKWIEICNEIKNKLFMNDIEFPVSAISEILKAIDDDHIIVSDVGNHEYWLCRASAFIRCNNPTFYSKSFGALGSSLGKSIGAYHSTKKPVYCFIGDQGLQMSIQELQHIAANQLPITIILLNNFSSGMIRSREKVKYGESFFPLHTTLESGYSVPDFCELANSYGIKTYTFDEHNYEQAKSLVINKSS
ncbi:MAG: thiamine pyrophosphate-binding protein, partial [Candidatus Marinimicrobia bacterium]|nr:thiamine pyrophosphate-binding protein [Candidatus Neomarinimicrobiota bacterium]